MPALSIETRTVASGPVVVNGKAGRPPGSRLVRRIDCDQQWVMRRLFPLAILRLASCVQFGQRSFPERKKQQVGAFTIEFSAGDEAYADVLADLLRKPKSNSWSVKPTPLGLKDLEWRRDYFVGRIAAYLGQAHLPPLTVSAYDRSTDDLLPRLFRETSEARRGKMSMATVYAAFEKLTGEKMLSYLPKAPNSVTQSRL
jgi:hypothetical protein